MPIGACGERRIKNKTKQNTASLHSGMPLPGAIHSSSILLEILWFCYRIFSDSYTPRLYSKYYSLDYLFFFFFLLGPNWVPELIGSGSFFLAYPFLCPSSWSAAVKEDTVCPGIFFAGSNFFELKRMLVCCTGMWWNNKKKFLDLPFIIYWIPFHSTVISTE